MDGPALVKSDIVDKAPEFVPEIVSLLSACTLLQLVEAEAHFPFKPACQYCGKTTSIYIMDTQILFTEKKWSDRTPVFIKLSSTLVGRWDGQCSTAWYSIPMFTSGFECRAACTKQASPTEPDTRPEVPWSGHPVFIVLVSSSGRC